MNGSLVFQIRIGSGPAGQRGGPPDPEASPPWDEARNLLLYRSGVHGGRTARCARGSPRVALDREMAGFARRLLTRGRPLLAAATDLMRRIRAEFRFAPAATALAAPGPRPLMLTVPLPAEAWPRALEDAAAAWPGHLRLGGAA